MKLHEAIEKLLMQAERPMTANEIANELNKNKWYIKRNKSQIMANQITARVDDHHELFDIDRSVSPLKINLCGKRLTPLVNASSTITKKIKPKKTFIPTNAEHSKTSFDPISNIDDTTILILGTMPGDKSIEIGEYYGHPRNRFWKIISTITGNDLPLTYSERKELLLKYKIGVWDVAHKVDRKGSLDNAIKDEEPNNLYEFITAHKNLKTICFNGKKAEVLYDKYFDKQNGIKYIALPSTSPANTTINFDDICKLWRQILNK